MNMRKSITIAIFAFFVFVTLGCEGDQGPVGPQGDQGPAGSVNIITQSNVLSLNNLIVEDNDFVYWTFPWAALTSDIYENGIVLAFVRDVEGSEWVPLPLPIDTTAMSYGFRTGEYEVAVFGEDADTLVLVMIGATVRAVAIPPSQVSSRIDHNDYDALVEYYQLNDVLSFE